MLFPTITFAVFFTLVLAAHAALADRPRPWRVAMLVASYVFYGWWDARFLALIAGSSVVDYLVGRGLDATDVPLRRRLLLVVSMTANLGLLAYFKYAGFFVESFVNAMADIGVTVDVVPPRILLPVGISFFTFQTMSYSIDVFRRELQASRSLLDFALYVSFFPQLVAGPIVRARDFLADLSTNDRRPLDEGRAVGLIAGGLFKKVVIADIIGAELVDGVFNNPQSATGAETLIAIYGYAVQIYADFSGYSDIAIGCALLLGFRFPQNFDQPYRALSLQDFWRRWHISLSSWLRDYLYISLGGNRKGRAKTYRNLLITMVLGGLWHGAGFPFLIWGLIHGLGLAVGRLWHDVRGTEPTQDHRIVKTLVTFHVVCAAWVFFRARSLADALDVFAALGNSWTSAGGVTTGVLLAIAVGLATQFVPKDRLHRLSERVAHVPLPAQAFALALVVVGIDVLGPDGVRAFIYFQF